MLSRLRTCSQALAAAARAWRPFSTRPDFAGGNTLRPSLASGDTLRPSFAGGNPLRPNINAGFLNRQEQNQEFRQGDLAKIKPMSFVRNILDADKNSKKDVVHISLIRNKTFVTVTDPSGNRKLGASAGSLEDRKGRSRLSRYAAEATAEHVGRSARKMGLNSFIVKVKGSTFFRKKRKVITSFREGFRGEGVGDQCPIAQICDVTQLPHNGCRLPKRRRI